MSDPSPEMRIVFLGTPDAAVPTLARVAGRFAVPLVVTNPDRRRGRGGRATASPVKQAAESLGIPVFAPDDLNSPESIDRVRETDPDVLLVVAYGKILRQAVLDLPRLLPINLHFSLLPEYRGAAPVARAIAEGKTETGVTVQRIVKRLDAGPVLAAARAAIGPEETAAELMERLALVGAGLTVRTLGEIADGRAVETPQDASLATGAPLLTKEEGRVDWSLPARVLHCHVRAMDPWPGAYTTFTGAAQKRELRVTIVRATRGPEDSADASPGTVTAADGDGILVATGSGQLRITKLKPSGKAALEPREFVNGYRATAGDHFE